MKELQEHWAVMIDDRIATRCDSEKEAVAACTDGAVVAHVKPRGLQSKAGFLRLTRTRKVADNG
jgi:hypothetical protein